MRKFSHNDNPTKEDSLMGDNFILEIAEIIRHCEPPKGIGINGYWGTGKTSALMQLEVKLIEIDQDISTIWFEAWRYQNDTLPVVALLNEIRESIDSWGKFANKSGDLFGVTLLGILGAFDKTIEIASGGLISPKLGDIKKIGEQWKQERYKPPLASQNINKLLESAIGQALGGGENKKLVIFIDDLDRCIPETALRLLEGIKIYLNLKNCVVIFGMDQRQIERALIKALGLDEEDKEHRAREYLEKICQDIYHLPLPDKKAKQKYLEDLLRPLIADADNSNSQHLTHLEKVLLKYDCLPANPRKIKALVNRLAVVIRREKFIDEGGFSVGNIRREYALLIAMTIIYTFHRQLNEQLEKNPAYINTVILFAQNYQAVDVDVREPMNGIKPSAEGAKELPTNPSDSNIFRLHQLFIDLDTITESEIKIFLGK